jgi:hypothetical protein
MTNFKDMFFASNDAYNAYCMEYSKYIINKYYDRMTKLADIQFKFA